MGKNMRQRVKKDTAIKMVYTHGKKRNAIANAVVQEIRVMIVANNATVALRTVMRSQRSAATTLRAYRSRQLLMSLFLAQQILAFFALHIPFQIARIAKA